jgi:hypothetical protein
VSGADHIVVGNVTIGPAHPFWSAEDSMAASIIRLEQENDELRAEVALLREEQLILQRKLKSERDEDCRESCRNKAAADGGWSNI